jgi:hypothetical protein
MMQNPIFLEISLDANIRQVLPDNYSQKAAKWQVQASRLRNMCAHAHRSTHALSGRRKE